MTNEHPQPPDTPPHSQFTLLASRRFLPFFITQFLGAFNDNVFKNALVVLLTFQAAAWTDMKAGTIANLAAGLFMLPYFLFSATAGQLADKYDRARLARLVKVLEMGIMVIAGVGFAFHHLTLLFVALFLLGCHSTLFGPVKYAILPQHLKDHELVGGNALIEAGTFASILLGTLAGGLLAGIPGGTHWITVASLAIAAAGYLASRFIPPAPAPAPDLVVHPNPISETWRNLGFAKANRAVFLSILGISWFWAFGAVFLAQFPDFAKTVLGGGESGVTLLLAVFTLGIGSGSLACEKLSGHQVETGLVPVGALGMTLFALDFAWASPAAPLADSVPGLLEHLGTWRLLADLLLLGVFGGFYCVPLYALIQQRSEATHRARIIAANNIMNALFMVLAAALAALWLGLGHGIPGLFGLAAVVNALVAIYICTLLPEFPLRALAWLGLRKS